MKIKITECGVFDEKGEELEVGTELTIDGDEVPAWLANKATIVDEKPAKGTAVNNKAD
jgi:hypothetical protein